MAFCRWLSAKLGANIRLPTDDEWEAAARGTDQRRYPYGPDFDATKGNTDETGIGQTTAVGIFPDGISPCGALDMSGNVWEWTLDEYRSRSSTNLASNETRSMRGGAWRLDSDHARAAYRDGHLFPFTQYSGIGFRMVLVGMSPFSNVLLPAKENARTAPRYRAMYRLPGYP
jgi:formylglycine-generating enzyme required for sulfatase activity